MVEMDNSSDETEANATKTEPEEGWEKRDDQPTWKPFFSKDYKT